jgi:acetyl-CoA carboxylase alpha subunit
VTAAANLKTAIITSLRELLGIAPADLLEQRYQRFRMYGTPGQQPVLSPTGEDA